jgi:hypothetical protein
VDLCIYFDVINIYIYITTSTPTCNVSSLIRNECLDSVTVLASVSIENLFSGPEMFGYCPQIFIKEAWNCSLRTEILLIKTQCYNKTNYLGIV